MSKKLDKHCFDRILNTTERRLSLCSSLYWGFTMLGGFSLPAWAVHSMDLFSKYQPLSWVIAGFIGLLIVAIFNLIIQYARKIMLKIRYDASCIDRGDKINPLDSTFEGKRIFINDFVIPSHEYIENKTFINCEIVGPACVYFLSNNLIDPLGLPKIDAVWLEPSKIFMNGIILNRCIFRNCSFHRITFFAGVENYENWRNHQNVNWISIPPTQNDIDKRIKDLQTPQIENEDLKKQIEDKTDDKN